MELPVYGQARELAWALVLGTALGLVYDLLRPLRRGRISTALTDLLFCALTALALPAFTLYGGGGRLRIFALFGILTGAALWFLTLSRPLRRLEAVFLRPLQWLAAVLLRLFRRLAAALLRPLRGLAGGLRRFLRQLKAAFPRPLPRHGKRPIRASAAATRRVGGLSEKNMKKIRKNVRK